MNNTNLLKNRMLNYIRLTLLVIEYYFAIFSFSVITVGENNIGTQKLSVLYMVHGVSELLPILLSLPI